MDKLTVGRIEFGPGLARDITKMVDKWTFEQKEAEVLKACLDWLACKRVFAWRSNNIAAPGRSFHGVAGVPDICAIVKGRFIGIECKATKGKQSAAQAAFQKQLEAAGGRYILARSLAALIEEMGDGRD